VDGEFEGELWRVIGNERYPRPRHRYRVRIVWWMDEVKQSFGDLCKYLYSTRPGRRSPKRY